MTTKKLNLKEVKKLKLYPFCTDERNVCFVQKINETSYSKEPLCTKFTIDKEVMINESKEVFWDFTVYNRFGKNTTRLSKAIFCGRRFHELMAYGITYDKDNLDLILNYAYKSAENAPYEIETTRLGWDFSNGNELFYGYDDSYSGDKNILPELSVSNNEKYFDTINKLIKNSLGCQLAISLSLSSVLVAYLEKTLHIGTPIFHFYGDSSSGKSTALILASSMWGNPSLSNKLYNSWNATDNALINSFNNNYGITLCFDEAGLLPRKNYSSIIYSISEGVDKSRYTSAINPPPHKTWQTVCLSSGEQSLLASSNQNSGLRVRSIEFLDLPITKSAKHSKQLKSFCSANYGIVGKWFVEDFCDCEDNIFADYRKTKNDFESLITTNRSTDERIATIFSVVLLTAQRLTKVLDLNIESLKKFFADYINETAYNAQPLVDRAYNAIIEWVTNNTTRINRYYNPTEKIKGAVAEKLDNSIIIKASDFKRLLVDRGFSDVNIVAKSLKKAGLLITEGNGLGYRYTFDKQRVECYRILLKDQETTPSIETNEVLNSYYFDEGGFDE